MTKVHPIYDSLPTGKENAIDTKSLCRMHNIASTRLLRTYIAEERCAGAIILSTTTGGYYKSQNRQEIADFIRTMENRAKNTLKVLKHAKRYMRTIENQMSIKDFI